MVAKKKILVASFDMEVGGVERSLISMLNHFDYDKYDVDLMLYSHTGDFMNLLPAQCHLLPESGTYRTLRMPIRKMIESGKMRMATARILAKLKARLQRSDGYEYRQMQYIWTCSLPFLPKLTKEYDTAISYLWPHYFVSRKVKADRKIAWIHTDSASLHTDIRLDCEMWGQYDRIAAVSEDCKQSFAAKYPSLTHKVMVIENIASPHFVRLLSNEAVAGNPMCADPRFKIVSVARLSHAKGIDQAVKAMKLLQDRGYDNIAWYVVGYGGEESVISNMIRDFNLQDRFFLLGKQLNPYPYMKEAALYVQPSRYEGKAVTVGEAQILSKPVLITNYATASSQLIHGYNGWITELSAEGIADGVERLYNNHSLREELADNCRKINYDNTSELDKLYQWIELSLPPERR